MATDVRDPMATDVREPFYGDEERYRESIRTRVLNLTDDELQQVHDLFHPSNHKDIPYEHWMLGARVRALIRKEQKQRLELAANE